MQCSTFPLRSATSFIKCVGCEASVERSSPRVSAGTLQAAKCGHLVFICPQETTSVLPGSPLVSLVVIIEVGSCLDFCPARAAPPRRFQSGRLWFCYFEFKEGQWGVELNEPEWGVELNERDSFSTGRRQMKGDIQTCRLSPSGRLLTFIHGWTNNSHKHDNRSERSIDGYCEDRSYVSSELLTNYEIN